MPSLDEIVGHPTDSLTFTVPDFERLKHSRKRTATLQRHVSAFQITHERMHACFKKLKVDVQQVCRTLNNIQECAKTLQSLDAAFTADFGCSRSNFSELYDKVDTTLGSWAAHL